ncbi:hypothetical protein H8356DRAFT_1735732 [Neocallimastix lanati (nom. inval.)]|nr:hypothetical protein H8356DRAFT_1735732 [Neocallimastix sp. JGI-2020a]
MLYNLINIFCFRIHSNWLKQIKNIYSKNKLIEYYLFFKKKLKKIYMNLFELFFFNLSVFLNKVVHYHYSFFFFLDLSWFVLFIFFLLLLFLSINIC